MENSRLNFSTIALAVITHWEIFIVLTMNLPNIFCLSRNFRVDRFAGVQFWYNANFIYKPGRIYSAPDTLLWILALNAMG